MLPGSLPEYCQWRDMRIRSTVNVLVPYFEVTLIGCFLTEGQFFPASCSPQIWFWVWYCLSPDAAAPINSTIPVACLEQPNTQINIIFVNMASPSYPDVSLLLSASLLLTTG